MLSPAPGAAQLGLLPLVFTIATGADNSEQEELWEGTIKAGILLRAFRSVGLKYLIDSSYSVYF